MRILLKVILLLCLAFSAQAQQWTGATDAAGTIGRTGMITLDGYNGTQIRLSSLGTYWGKIGNPSSQVWSLGYGDATTTFNSVLNWTSSGMVGIGITPATKLHVKGDFRLTGETKHSEFAFYRVDGLKFASIGQGNLTADNSTFDIQHYNGNDIRFLSNGTEQLRIAATGGYVGIGVASPAVKLHVKGDLRLTGEVKHAEVSFFRTDGVKFASIGQANLGVDNSTFDIQHFNGNDIRFLNGSTEQVRIRATNGNVGIGTANPTQKLEVKGTVYSSEVRVDVQAGTGPDYVFERDYKLPSLESIQSYIDENKHLPEVPSAKEMEAKGVNLSDMNMLLLKKIEELTLYILQQEKRIKELEKITKK